jgi:hypothetical protein
VTDIESRLRKALHDETSGLMAHPTMADDMVAHGSSVRRRRRRIASGVAAVAVLAAIAPVWWAVDHSPSPLQPVKHGPSVPTHQTRPATSHPSTPHQSAWGQLPIDVSHAPKRPAGVVNVRVGRHPTYDRVVIDFSGPISGYRIERVTRLVQDASGAVVRLPGTDKVLIRLTPAVAHSATGQSLYAGPNRAVYDMPALRGVAFVGDHEGVVSVGLGVDNLTDVRVLELDEPGRLVIDLHH